MPLSAMRRGHRQFRPGRREEYACAVCFAVLLVAAPALAYTVLPHHRQPKPVVHTIEALERTFQDAQVHGNVSLMADLLSDDFLGISPDGTLLTKQEMLDAYRNGSIHITTLDTLDERVRVYGSTAVVLTKVRVTGTINGNNISGHYRYTRVYHQNSKGWKIVSFEASKVVAKKQRP